MQNMNPFPAQAKTLPISVSSTASTSAALPAVGSSLRVVNLGPNKAFISVGTGSQTATLPNATPTATSTPILAGEDCTFSIPGAYDSTNGTAASPLNISAVCAATETATLYVQVGEGI